MFTRQPSSRQGQLKQQNKRLAKLDMRLVLQDGLVEQDGGCEETSGYGQHEH